MNMVLTHIEIRRLVSLSKELNNPVQHTFHMILKDSLDNWTNGLKECQTQSHQKK